MPNPSETKLICKWLALSWRKKNRGPTGQLFGNQVGVGESELLEPLETKPLGQMRGVTRAQTQKWSVAEEQQRSRPHKGQSHRAGGGLIR